MNPNYQFDLGLTPSPARRKSRWLKVSGIIASIVVVAGLLVYSGGMDSLLKLLGVGASGIYDITITNNRDFVGDAKFFTEGSQPEMEGVSVFDQFTGTPADPNQSGASKGFVAPVFSSPQDPANELYKEHYYVSPVIDMTLNAATLSAVEVTQFNSAESNISYAYRVATQSSLIPMAKWQPLDPSVVNSTTEDSIQVRTAIVEQNIDRFVQVKFTFENVLPSNRAAVYAISLQYKEGAPVDSGMIGNNASEREISLNYGSVNAPANVDIDVLSADLQNRVVYTQKQVDLAERISYTFTTTLAPGAYALVVSGPTIETQIMPFEVGALAEKIGVELTSFSVPTGQNSTYDLNGDGVVNTIDLQLLMSRFTP